MKLEDFDIMDTINRQVTLCFGIIGLALALGLAVACEDEKEDLFEEQCFDNAYKAADCEGYSFECFSEDCAEECTSRGHKAAKFGDDCGELWVAVHACVVALDCEMWEEWGQAQYEGKSGFPCEDVEVKFRQECPGAPLFPKDL